MKTCSKCQIVKPLVGFYLDKNKKDGRHTICKECVKARRRSMYAADPTKFKASNVKWQRRNGKRKAEYALRVRREVLAAYGGRCACCGEDTEQFLGVDHIFNDGAEERRRYSGASSIYYFLKRQGFPKDRYQLLCHNCNMAKGIYGSCPHTRLRLVVAN